jgi:hypothetical protein
MPENRRVESMTSNYAKELLDDPSMMPQPKPKPEPTEVSFPTHLFPPKNVASFDARKVCMIDPTGTGRYELFSFQVPPGTSLVITHYALYCDALDSSLVSFSPEVDGNRVWPFHGDPTNGFSMNLGLAPDLSNVSLIEGNMILQPSQKFTWWLVNRDTVPVAMGARLKGYFDSKNKLESGSFGS